MIDSKWLPMTDALEDGTPILLVAELGRMDAGFWLGLGRGWRVLTTVPLPIPGGKV